MKGSNRSTDYVKEINKLRRKLNKEARKITQSSEAVQYLPKRLKEMRKEMRALGGLQKLDRSTARSYYRKYENLSHAKSSSLEGAEKINDDMKYVFNTLDFVDDYMDKEEAEDIKERFFRAYDEIYRATNGMARHYKYEIFSTLVDSAVEDEVEFSVTQLLDKIEDLTEDFNTGKIETQEEYENELAKLFRRR